MKLHTSLIALFAAGWGVVPACAPVEEDPSQGSDEGEVGVAAQAVTTCVTIQRGTFGAVEDASIASNVTTPDWNPGSLRVGSSLLTLIRFDLSTIPSNASIDSATLSLTTTAVFSGQHVLARVAAASWSEAAVTYGSFNQQFGKSAGMLTPSAPNTVHTMSVNLTRVQGWVDGTLPNHGMLLSLTDLPGQYGESAFVSSESPTVALRPKLDVCYTPFDYCASAPCQNGATCESGAAGYTCQCAPGFTGTSCETNIDECAGSPCENGATCVDGINGYTCQCAAGFTGTNCQTASKILFIDDSFGLPVAGAWTSALAAGGFAYDTETLAPNGDPGHVLANYRVVIWTVGDRPYTNLTAANVATLTAYLNGGGRLLYAGGHCLYSEPYAAASFVPSYLGLKYFAFNMPTYVNNGLPVYALGTGNAITGSSAYSFHTWASGAYQGTMFSAFAPGVGTASGILKHQTANLTLYGSVNYAQEYFAVLNVTPTFKAMTWGFDLNMLDAPYRQQLLVGSLNTALLP